MVLSIIQQGPEFDEDGAPHQRMVVKLRIPEPGAIPESNPAMNDAASGASWSGFIFADENRCDLDERMQHSVSATFLLESLERWNDAWS